MFVHKFAVIALIGIACSGCIESSSTASKPPPPLKINFEPKKFASCGDLQKWQGEKLEKFNYRGDRDGIPVSSPTVAPSPTNNQESDVDESDVVKVDDRFIYFARSKSIEVISRKSLELVQTLELGRRSKLKLLLFNNRLVAIGEESSSQKFTASIFSVLDDSTDAKLRLVDEFELAGQNTRARLIGSNVVMISQVYVDFTKPLDELMGVSCAQIQEPVVDDLSVNITALHRLELGSDKPRVESHAVIGSAEQIYVTTRSIYLASYSYRWFPTDPDSSSSLTDTIVMRFDVDTFNFKGVDSVSGTTNNQFSFHESGDYLFIATTLNSGLSSGGNRLWTIGLRDSKFRLLAKSEVFAPREDIRSARFVGDKAYIVTFEKTDPLYTFDLRDPLKPVILNELKMPGFSAYLHAIGDDLLFGAGYGASADDGFSWFAGVQLSIFRLFNDGRVDIVDQKEFGGRGSHVDVGLDHHAIAFDRPNNLIYLPIRVMAKSDKQQPWEYSKSFEFSGVYILDSNTGVEPIGSLSQRDMIPPKCILAHETPNFWSFASPNMDIRRILVLPEGVITLSSFGVRLFESNSPFAARQSLVFEDGAGECLSLNQGPVLAM